MSGFKALSSPGRATPGPLESRAEQSRIRPRTIGYEEQSRCPKCAKIVYHAEEILAGGQKWHKICFYCGLCLKRLDSTCSTEHEGDVYCKQCYGRKFGPKGVGFGGGAGCLSMDKGEVFGNTESARNKPLDPYYGQSGGWQRPTRFHGQSN